MGNRIRLFIILFSLMASTVYAKTEKNPDKMINLDEIVVPIIVRHQVLADLLLKVKIEIRDKYDPSIVEKLLLRIRDSFLEELYIAFPLLWDGESRPSFQIVTQRLYVAAGKMVPKDFVRHIHIDEMRLLNKHE